MITIHEAAKNGDLAVVRRLIESGASVDERNPNQFTPLHQAARYGNTDVARYLLDHGSDLEARAENGETPLLMAITFRWRGQANPNVIRLLAQRGANMQAMDNDGWFPLYAAVQRAALQAAEALLLAGTPINQKTNFGQTAFDRALIEKDRKTTDITLQDRQAMIQLLTAHGGRASS